MKQPTTAKSLNQPTNQHQSTARKASKQASKQKNKQTNKGAQSLNHLNKNHTRFQASAAM
jgi:hypothetical protein